MHMTHRPASARNVLGKTADISPFAAFQLESQPACLDRKQLQAVDEHAPRRPLDLATLPGKPIQALPPVLQGRVHRRYLGRFPEKAGGDTPYRLCLERRHGEPLDHLAFTIARRRPLAECNLEPIGLVGIEQQAARLGRLAKAHRE
jgi:hypothetical protein